MIVDRLTKFVLFLYIRTNSIDKLAMVYIDEVIRLHGLSVIIVSD